METLKYTWDNFEEDVAIINGNLNTIPHDLLCGIAAGGLPLVAKLKNVRGQDYIVLQCRSYKEKKQQDVIIQGITGDVFGKKIILLEDIADHGLTLLAIKQRLLELGATSVVTVCLFYKKHSIVVPDFYLHEVPNETWVEFCWE